MADIEGPQGLINALLLLDAKEPISLAPIRARTPHGSYTFKITNVSFDGEVILHLEEVRRDGT